MSSEAWGGRMRARMIAVLAVAAAVVGNVVAGGAIATAAGCAPPEVSVTGTQQYEGSGDNTKTFVVIVTMAQPESGCAAAGSVHYRTLDGSADAGQDYVATTSTLSWTAPGHQVVAVQVERDDVAEPDEEFAVELFGPRGVEIVGQPATVTIYNDDASVLGGGGLVVAIPAGGICWWPSDHCSIPVRLNTIARAPVSLSLRTVDGTAVAGKDYVPIKKLIVTIRTGGDRVNVPVELLTGAEPGEYFGVEISDVTAGTISGARGVVTIREG